MLQLLRADELQPGYLVAQAGPCVTATENPMPLRFEAVHKADTRPDGVHVLWSEAAGRYVYTHDRLFLVETSTAKQSEYARLQPDVDFREQLQQAKLDGAVLNGSAAMRLADDAGWLRSAAREALEEIEARTTATGTVPAGELRGLIFRGDLQAMTEKHTELLRTMTRTGQVYRVQSSRSTDPIVVSTCFRGEIVRCIVLMVPGDVTLLALITLFQQPGEIGLDKKSEDAKALSLALSCQHCRYVNNCPKPSVRRWAFEHKQLRSCHSFELHHDMVRKIVRIVNTCPTTEIHDAQPS